MGLTIERKLRAEREKQESARPPPLRCRGQRLIHRSHGADSLGGNKATADVEPKFLPSLVVIVLVVFPDEVAVAMAYGRQMLEQIGSRQQQEGNGKRADDSGQLRLGAGRRRQIASGATPTMRSSASAAPPQQRNSRNRSPSPIRATAALPIPNGRRTNSSIS